MRLATFNLENLGGNTSKSGAGATALRERISLLRPQLNRLKADVICLQEVNGQKVPGRSGRELTALRSLLDGTAYQDFHCFSSEKLSGDGVSDVHNLVVLSRHPIVESKQLWHTHIDPPSYRLASAEPPVRSAEKISWDRPILHCRIVLEDGRSLHVINLHLRAPLAAAIPGQKETAFKWRSVRGWAEGYFIAAMKRTGQALETRFLIDDILDGDPEALIAVCGDFNAEQNEAAMRVIEGGEDDTGNGGLAYRMLIPVERSISSDRRYSVLHHARPQMLDHILASRFLLSRLQHVEIHNEMLEDEIVGYTKIMRSPSSYHAPIVADFDLG